LQTILSSNKSLIDYHLYQNQTYVSRVINVMKMIQAGFDLSIIDADSILRVSGLRLHDVLDVVEKHWKSR